MTQRKRKRKQIAKSPPSPAAVITPPAYVFGRPTRLTPELAVAVIKIVRTGMSLQGCAHYAGITMQTLDNWRARGRKVAESIEAGQIDVDEQERPYLDFFGGLEKARADREVEAVLNVRSMKRGWQAEAWFLERCHVDRYGRKFIRLEHTGKDGQPIEHVDKTVELTDAERVRRLQAVLKLEHHA